MLILHSCSLLIQSCDTQKPRNTLAGGTHRTQHPHMHVAHHTPARSISPPPLRRKPQSCVSSRFAAASPSGTTPLVLAWEYPWLPYLTTQKLNKLLTARVHALIILTEHGALSPIHPHLSGQAARVGIDACTIEYHCFLIRDSSLRSLPLYLLAQSNVSSASYTYPSLFAAAGLPLCLLGPAASPPRPILLQINYQHLPGCP